MKSGAIETQSLAQDVQGLREIYDTLEEFQSREDVRSILEALVELNQKSSEKEISVFKSKLLLGKDENLNKKINAKAISKEEAFKEAIDFFRVKLLEILDGEDALAKKEEALGDSIYLLLLYLAKYWPINTEDLITLEEFTLKHPARIIFSTGHQSNKFTLLKHHTGRHSRSEEQVKNERGDIIRVERKLFNIGANEHYRARDVSHFEESTKDYYDELLPPPLVTSAEKIKNQNDIVDITRDKTMLSGFGAFSSGALVAGAAVGFALVGGLFWVAPIVLGAVMLVGLVSVTAHFLKEWFKEKDKLALLKQGIDPDVPPPPPADAPKKPELSTTAILKKAKPENANHPLNGAFFSSSPYLEKKPGAAMTLNAAEDPDNNNPPPPPSTEAKVSQMGMHAEAKRASQEGQDPGKPSNKNDDNDNPPPPAPIVP